MQQRGKINSSKANLVVSVIFHTLLVLVLFYFAAKEGILGKKMQTIAVTMVKEKKPEAPKEKAPEPKVEPAKVADAAKPVNIPAPKAETSPAPAPGEAPPSAAPALAVGPDMEFSDGAHEVAVADANTLYKIRVENALKRRWNRPENLPDESFVAEAELNVDKQGHLGPYVWVRGSGNRVWDDSVKAALEATKTVDQVPPKGFPGKFVVRFDIEASRTEDVIQVSSR